MPYIELKTKDLTTEERKMLKDVVRRIARRREYHGLERLQYRIHRNEKSATENGAGS